MRGSAANQPSENDPARIAHLLTRLAEAANVPKRLVLGRAAQAYVDKVEAARAKEAEANRALTRSTMSPDVPRT